MENKTGKAFSFRQLKNVLYHTTASLLIYAVLMQSVIFAAPTRALTTTAAPNGSFSFPAAQSLLSLTAVFLAAPQIGDLISAGQNTVNSWLGKTTENQETVNSPAPAARGISSTDAAISRHRPSLNGGTIEGSLRVFSGESFAVNSQFRLTNDLFVVGTPNITVNSGASHGGVINDGGNAQPAGYGITLNSGTILPGKIHTRADAFALPSDIPTSVPNPSGTRYVNVNTPTDLNNIGNWATVRTLNVSPSNQIVNVPPGNYDTFTANGSNIRFVFSNGTYNFSGTLNLNSGSSVEANGQVTINIGQGLNVNNGSYLLGNNTNPSDVKLNVIGSSLTIDNGSQINALVRAINANVNLNNGLVRGHLIANYLNINNGRIVGAATVADTTAPTINITSPSNNATTENASSNISGNAADAGNPASGIARVTVNNTDAAFNSQTGNWTLNNFSLNSGANTVTAVAFDNAGNQASAQITVNRVINQPPTAGAGVDQTIELPNSAQLNGSASDDGYPTGSSLSISWTKLSGSGNVTFSNPHNLATGASFSASGNYILRLTASDGQLTATDDVAVTVRPQNQPPTVDAGQNQTIELPNGANLSGVANDDGNPAGSNVSVSWNKLSGEGDVTFSNPNNLSTSADFTAAGTYVLRLTATDGSLSATDDVTIIVNPQNQAPTVSAGDDQTITLPNTLNLSGTASDDGFPQGNTLTTTWSKTSGDGKVTFSNPESLTTAASFSQAGTYVLKLTAGDGQLNSSDEITITVNLANQAPTVNAGNDLTANSIIVPVNLNGIVTDDGLPGGSNLTVSWSKVSGAGEVSFADAQSAATTATFSQTGVYVLRLTATDGALTVADELSVTVGMKPTAAFTVPGIARNAAVWDNNLVSYFEGAEITEFSSQYSNSYQPNYAIDDSSSSYWSSASGQTTNQFIVISFPGGEIRSLDRFRLLNATSTAAVKDFEIQVSTTDTASDSWTTVLSDTALQNNRVQEFILAAPVEAKYVRLFVRNNYGSTAGLSLHGFEAINSNFSGIPSYFEYPSNAVQTSEGGKIISSSSQAAANLSAANTIDGSNSSYWSTANGQINNQSFVVQLAKGKSFPLDRFRILNYNAAQGVRDFRVDVSNSTPDEQNFTNVLSGTLVRNAELQEFVLAGGATNVRYVRFTAINNHGNISNTRLAEFQAVTVPSSLTSVSSYYSPAYRPEMMLDNSASTYWQTASGKISDQWVKIKLAHADGELIEGVKIQPSSGAAAQAIRDFEVLVSTTTDEDAAFVSVLSSTALNDGTKQAFNFPNGTIRARYVKLVVKNNYGAADYIRVSEFEATAAGSDGNIISDLLSPVFNRNTSPSLISSGATAVATSGSSGNSATYAPNNILDYVSGSPWRTNGLINQFLTVKLGGDATRQIKGVRLGRQDATSTDTVKDFEIWVSTTDASDAAFSRVFTGTVLNNRTVQTFYFSSPVDARYVKLIPKNNYGGASYISVSDFEVLAEGAGGLLEAPGQYNQNYRPEYAFDGNGSTGWVSAQNAITNQSFKLALPVSQPAKIYGLSIQPDSSYSPKNFEVKISMTTFEDSAFTSVFSGVLAKSSEAQTFLFDALKDAKYVQIVFRDGYHAEYLGVDEISVLAVPAEGATLLGYSSRYSASYPAENALDFDTLTGYWATANGQNANQFIKFALPSGSSDGWLIDHLALQANSTGADSPRNFEVQTSANDYSDAGFQTVFAGTLRNDGTLQHFFFNPVKAKYVRLLIKNNYGGANTSVRTFWVFSPQVGNLQSRFLNRSKQLGSSLSYLWEFGDGSGSIERDPAHLFVSPGLYNIRLTATDGNSLTDTFELPYLVRGTSEIDFSWLPVPVKEGHGAAFTDTSKNRINQIREWNWDDNTEASITGSEQISHAFADNGTYNVNLRAADNRGIYTQKTKAVEVINQPPTVNAAGPATVYAYEEWTSTASVSDPGLTDRESLVCQWEFSDGQVSGEFTDCYASKARITRTFSAAGSYIAKLTVRDKDGASASDTFTINVNKVPTIITYLGDEWAEPGQPLRLKARLIRSNDIATLAGKQIVFSFDGNVYTATTDALGAAETTITFNGGSTSQITARFAGDNAYLPSETWTCGEQRQPVDVVVVIDHSGSMSGQKLIDARNGAKIFVDALKFNTDQAGVVGFGSVATLRHELSNDAVSIKNAIDGINISGSTRMDLGIDAARIELTGSRRNPSAVPVMLVLSDGYSQGNPTAAAQLAKDAGIRIVSIGLGEANEAQMKTIASAPSDYYYTPDSASLAVIYAAIAGTFCQRENLAPVVGAGEDKFIRLPVNSVALSGTALDDGLPNNTLTVTWTKQEGPDGVTFENPNAPATTASFTQTGVYVLRLTASDGQFTRSSDVRVTVAGINAPPQISAGNDKTAVTGAFLQLEGSVTDDGNPVGGNFSVNWTKVSGPGNVSMDNANILNAKALFSSPGTYVLRLTANDGELETSDDVRVTVSQGAANQPPSVNAGANQAVTISEPTVILNGTVTDDGLPGGGLTVTWTKTSGDGNVVFANPDSAQTTVTFDALGTYVLKLTASDGQYVASHQMAVTVKAQNEAPTVEIGQDRTIIQSQTPLFQPQVADDGLPVGGNLSAVWTKISGDGSVTFSNPNQPATYATFSQTGVYVLRLSVSDSQLSASDEVTVTVAENQPAPTADILITDGASVTEPLSIGGSISGGSWKLEYSPSDGGGNPNNRIWTTVAQNTGAASGNLGVLDTSLMLNGLYDIRLTASDQFGRTTSETISVSVEKNLKVGHFTVSFDDMNVPVAGVPMQIIRTYDSRDKRQGDFGYGWTLSLRNVRVQRNVVLGTKWFHTTSGGSFPTYCVQPTRPHIVTVTMPDGLVEKFEAKLEKQCQQLVPMSSGRVVFTPQAGTRGKLAINGSSEILIAGNIPGEADLLDFDNSNIFDSATYKYTSKDGTEFVVNQNSGLQSVKDLNGNTLAISSGGIVHSSGASIVFNRDAQGRITSITDPSGVSNIYSYDANGDLISYKDRENNATSFTYETELPHHLKSIIDPLGRTPIRNEYDDTGRLLKHIDANDNEFIYTHDLAARSEIVTDRLGNAALYEYDTRGNVLVKRDALGNQTTFSYDANDNVLTETNALGKTTTYTYDVQDNRTSVTDSLGNRTEFTYNSRGQLLTEKDARNNITTNTYDARGNLLTTTDALGNKTQTFTYNASGGKPASFKDALDNITTFEYTGNNLTKETDAQGNITLITYDAFGKPKSETQTRTLPGGATETLTTGYEYDKLNRLTKTAYPDGTFAHTEYNELGRRTATVDRAGNRTEFEYDALGRLKKTTYPDGKFEESTYDAEGRRLTLKDRAGRITGFEYDAVGRLKKTVYADGSFTQTSYDALGQTLSTTDERGNLTTFVYDDGGRQTQVKNALNQITHFGYDANGNQTSMTDALNRTTVYEYDALDRNAKTIFADSSFTQTTYDALGRRTAVTDQAGKTTQFVYDSLGRLTKVTNALGHATSYSYNEIGARISQTDARNNQTQYEYDRAGRRTKRILPLGQVETYSYDAAGNLQTRTDSNGKTTTFVYDSMNRLLSKTPDASLNQMAVSFTYNDDGRRATMTDASGTTVYSYDAKNRLTNKQTPFGTLSYTYDAGGNIKTLRSSNAGGVSVDYSYDELNRLQTVRDNNLSGSQSTAYTYDTAGNLQSYTYPNQVTTSYAYNNLNRLTTLTTSSAAGSLASYAYTLDPSGNRTRVIENSARTVDYTYDSLYRLTRETIANDPHSNNGQIGYSYDAIGNRLQRNSTVPAISGQSSTYDANDRLISDVYDANGNTKVSGSGGKTYNYDFEDKLISSSDGVTIVYDGDGNRVTKTVGGVMTFYLVDTNNLTGYAQVVEEIQSGSVVKTYTYGLALISQQHNGTVSFYGLDGQGSTRSLIDGNGSVTDTYNYDAFGNLINRSGTTANDYLYAGEQYDADLGFYYNRARYLNASTGRFQTPDKYEGIIFEPGTLHKYLYTNNNPVNFSDPTGFYTQGFGYAVEREVQPIYAGDNAGDKIIFGRWTKEGPKPPRGKVVERIVERLYRLKPDIRNIDKLRIVEIKPFSLSGLRAGVVQMVMYIAGFAMATGENYYPHLEWNPSRNIIQVNELPVAIVNIGGILFYTDVKEKFNEFLALATIEAARRLIIIGRMGEFGRVVRYVTSLPNIIKLDFGWKFGVAANNARAGYA